MATRTENRASEPIVLDQAVARLPQSGLTVRFGAKPAECEALAAFLDILAVESLDAELALEPSARDAVRVRGTVRAKVVQACVVSLDPVPLAMSESVDRLFVPAGSRLARSDEGGELLLDPNGAEMPDTFDGDAIALGVLITETVALGLDPYPRADAAPFEAYDTDPDPKGADDSPFAALRQLKPENDNGAA